MTLRTPVILRERCQLTWMTKIPLPSENDIRHPTAATRSISLNRFGLLDVSFNVSVTFCNAPFYAKECVVFKLLGICVQGSSKPIQ